MVSMKKFHELREQANKFIYKSYEIVENEKNINLKYHYQLMAMFF
jgi:hypothetical protein